MDPALEGNSRTFGVVDYILFGVTLVISLCIGIYFSCTGGQQKTTSEFLMADRKMSFLPVTLSLLASFMSAITLLGTPSEIYLYGTQYLALGLGYFLVIPASAHLFIPIFYRLGLTSTYEYLQLRFHRSVRILGACCFILQMTLYMAIVLYAPSLALNAVTGLNVWVSVCSVGIVCMLYTTLGGMKAVMWTDSFQICMMYAGLLACIIQGGIFHGGFGNIWDYNVKGGRVEFDNFDPDPTVRHSWWSLTFGGFFTWVAIYGVNQAQVQRVFAVPNLKQGQIALWLNLPGLLSLMIITSVAGLVCFATYRDCDPVKNGDIAAYDQILPLFVMDHLSQFSGLPGLFTACIFSGALSTLSSGLNSLAAVTTFDIVGAFLVRDISDATATKISKGLAVFYGILTVGLTFVASQLGTVLQAALGLFGMIGGPLLGVFVLGIFIPWSNWKGAFVGVLTGLVVTLWIGIGAQVHKPTLWKAPISTYGCPNPDLFNMTTMEPLTTPAGDLTAAEWVFHPDAPSAERTRDIYSISYIWYSFIAVVTVCTVGMIVSAITGFQKPEELDPRLISPFFDIICCWLPGGCRRKLWCGVRHDHHEEYKFNPNFRPSTTIMDIPLEDGTGNPAFSNADKSELPEKSDASENSEPKNSETPEKTEVPPNSEDPDNSTHL